MRLRTLVKMEVKYDLTKSPSCLDRKYGQHLINRGDLPIGSGYIVLETRDSVILQLSRCTGRIEIPKGALIWT